MNGNTKRKITKPLVALVIGVVAIALVAGLAIAGLSQTTSVSAAPVVAQAQSTPASTAITGTVTPGAKTKTANSQYSEAFRKAFAQALGVDESKLDPAYSTAIASVVDQAVKDGKLTQAQADQIKARSSNGFQNGFGGFGFDKGFGGRGGFGAAGAGFANNLTQVFDTAASTIGITTDQLKTELQGGKSVAQVAQAHNVDVAKVKTAVLANAKTQLDQAVKDGKLTQAQADQANTMLTNRIDQILNSTQTNMGHKFGH